MNSLKKSVYALHSFLAIVIVLLCLQTNNAVAGGADLMFIPEKTTVEITTNDWDFNVKIAVHIKNAGDQNILLPFRMGFYLTKGNTVTTNDLYLNYGEIAGLWAGYENTMTITINLAYEGFKLNENGTYHIGVIVDDENKIKETNENNNSYVIEKEINYVVPSAKAKSLAYLKEKEKAKDVANSLAGKILFAAGSIDQENITGNSFGTEFTFKQFTEATGNNGADFSFLVMYNKPLKELFEGYIKSGLDSKAWNTDVNYVNLYFKLIIDGNQTVVSDNEFENVRFNSNEYSYVLLGEYAQSQTLQLQNILLTELYKLSAGTHTVKMQVYVRSAVTGVKAMGPDPVSEGEFTINVNTDEKVAYFKKRNAEIYPPSKMKNPQLESSIKSMAVEFFSGLDSKFSLASIKYTALLNNDWSYYKNERGVVLYRQTFVMMYLKLSNGSCKLAGFNVEQQNIGNNTYSKIQLSPGVNYAKNLSPMPCEVIR